jgi:fused signal recognition particle receptor
MAFSWFKRKKSETDAAESESAMAVDDIVTPDASSEPASPPAPDEAASPPAPDEAESPPTPDDPAPSGDAVDSGETPSPQSAEHAEKKSGFFGRLKRGLSKTHDILTTDIDELFTVRRKLDDDLLEELEELLITADVGVQTTMPLVEKVSHQGGRINGPDDLKAVLRDEMRALLPDAPDVPQSPPGPPHVIMVVGVNGVGKTTTIGKLAAKAAAGGNRVLIGAADTFRAAAIEQMSIWAERAGADIVRHRENSDPAAVAFDAVEAGMARGADVVLIDTAGRLHTKVNLMEELKKIKRAIGKKMPDAPHDILLVLDATTGQNAVSQAKLFHEALDITALALTKLDGTAKGGIVISICDTMNIPLRYIGVGEQIDDLQDFDPDKFLEALL